MMENKFSDHYSSTSRGAYSVKKGLTIKEIEEIAKDQYLKVIVIDSLTKSEFENLEKYIFSKKSNVLLSKTSKLLPEPLDLSFLRHLPSLKKLRICDATQLTNFDNIEFMNELEELSFYRFEPELLEILKIINPDNIKSLSIEGNLSKGYSVDFISKFNNLKSLHIEGPCKGIEEIGKLLNLEELVLRSISLPNLNFIGNLNKLWSIDIKLGGIKDFTVLSKLPQVKYLELWQIKGLSDISFISKMTELQNLHLESMINVTDLPSLEKLKKLRRIKLMNLKGLTQFNKLKSAPNLEDFFFTMIHQQQPEDLIPVLQNPNLKNIYVYFPSDKKNKAFEALAKTHGKQISDWPEFKYN
jgi:hypothetical protein